VFKDVWCGFSGRKWWFPPPDLLETFANESSKERILLRIKVPGNESSWGHFAPGSGIPESKRASERASEGMG